jgi:hypothetical protein
MVNNSEPVSGPITGRAPLVDEGVKERVRHIRIPTTVSINQPNLLVRDLICRVCVHVGLGAAKRLQAGPAPDGRDVRQGDDTPDLHPFGITVKDHFIVVAAA